MALPAVDPAEVPDQGVITISGSSTVYPVTRQIALKFRQAGYPGGLKVEQVGTTAGFEQFCAKDGIDIVDASSFELVSGRLHEIIVNIDTRDVRG